MVLAYNTYRSPRESHFLSICILHSCNKYLAGVIQDLFKTTLISCNPRPYTQRRRRQTTRQITNVLFASCFLQVLLFGRIGYTFGESRVFSFCAVVFLLLLALLEYILGSMVYRQLSHHHNKTSPLPFHLIPKSHNRCLFCYNRRFSNTPCKLLSFLISPAYTFFFLLLSFHLMDRCIIIAIRITLECNNHFINQGCRTVLSCSVASCSSLIMLALLFMSIQKVTLYSDPFEAGVSGPCASSPPRTLLFFFASFCQVPLLSVYVCTYIYRFLAGSWSRSLSSTSPFLVLPGKGEIKVSGNRQSRMIVLYF